MMKSMMFAFAALAACGAGAITATKDYVDRRYTDATNYAAHVSSGAGGITTNDVCAIVTNTHVEIGGPWYIDEELSFLDNANVTELPEFVGGRWLIEVYDTILGEYRDVYTDASEDAFSLRFFYAGEGIADVYFVRPAVVRNALGLARFADLDGITNGLAAASITNGLVTKTELQAVSNEASVIYRLFSGSNVVMEVTNYNSIAHAPSMRLLQLNESNEYFTVWAETNGLAIVSNSLARSCALEVSQALETVESNYAPRAWSRVTSGLGAEAPSNTTWISTPTTVIAGGLEYAKVVHANGAIWVLSGNGMMNFDPTTNAYLRISADDGTDIFAIEKTDAVTVGADASGISLAGNVITIPVPVVSADHPTMYWRFALDSGDWEDESTFHAVTGGAVNWGGTSGAWVCTVQFDWQPPDSMFFKFTYTQPGSTVIRNNASVDVSGGIMCTDGVHKCRPVYNNGSITWEVVP